MAHHRRFGAALRKVREQRQVRLRELSDELRVSLPFLSDVENGRRLLSEERIRQAAQFLDVDPLPLLELAVKDRGTLTLTVKSLPDRKAEAAVLFAMSLPDMSDDTINYIVTRLRMTQ